MITIPLMIHFWSMNRSDKKFNEDMTKMCIYFLESFEELEYKHDLYEMGGI